MHDPPHILIVDADSSAARVTRTLVERVAPHSILAVEANAERGLLSVQQISTEHPDNRSLTQQSFRRAVDQAPQDISSWGASYCAYSSTLMLRRQMMSWASICISKSSRRQHR